MVAKLGRQQFGKQPMILVSVIALRTEHHIRLARSAEVAQAILDSSPVCGRPTVRYVETVTSTSALGQNADSALCSSASRFTPAGQYESRTRSPGQFPAKVRQSAAHPIAMSSQCAPDAISVKCTGG
jgi:hypothetical protein